MVSTARLTCVYCGEFIKKADNDHTTRTDITGTSGIERAWHNKCVQPPDDSPFDAAVLQATQAVQNARRLGPEEFRRFGAAVMLLLAEPKSP